MNLKEGKMMTVNGKEITLYYPDGTIIPSIEEFIDFYSKCYYVSNNIEVEKTIEDILKTGIKSSKELFRVLAWKLGKINMKKSKGTAFVYYEEMTEGNMKLRLYKKEHIMVKSDIEDLYEIVERYFGKCKTDKKAKDFLNDIIVFTDEKSWGDYFYPVYMITLLYFVSNGRYPIVDSFSYVALDAICNHIEYGTRKTYPGLIGKNNDKFKEIVTKGTYKKYKEWLKEIFGEKAQSREVDQALWVYGKLFKK